MENRMQNIREQMQKFKELIPFSSIIDDVTHSEYMMLKMIHRGMECCADDRGGGNPRGLRTTALSEHLYISKPAVSQMLNVLESKGLIERIMTKHDRRVVYVVLTPEGAKKFASVRRRFDEFAEEMFQRMGEEDTDQLLYLLNKLSTIVEELKNKNGNSL